MSTEFVAGVQANCDLADARHARDLTLCTYLLQMREKIRAACGAPNAEIHFLVGGTQTNATVIDALLRGTGDPDPVFATG